MGASAGFSITGLIALGLAVFHLIKVSKHATNKDWNGLITAAIAFAGGTGATFIAGANHLLSLANVSGGAKTIIGFAVAAAGGLINDYLRARNNADSSVMPTLLPSASAAASAQDDVSFQPPAIPAEVLSPPPTQ